MKAAWWHRMQNSSPHYKQCVLNILYCYAKTDVEKKKFNKNEKETMNNKYIRYIPITDWHGYFIIVLVWFYNGRYSKKATFTFSVYNEERKINESTLAYQMHFITVCIRYWLNSP